MQSRIICVNFVFESVVGSLLVLGRNKKKGDLNTSDQTFLF